MAKIYWRSIQRGRAFDSIPEDMKDAVIALARADVEGGVITAEQYKDFIGVEYDV